MRHRILIVDDEEIVLVALGETLRREGYEVVTASNGVQALELLKQGAFSVILTDHQMPLLTGLDFLAQVRQIQPDATRILITAVLSLSTVIDAINKGEVYRFIVKPWLREELLATVKNAAQRYELSCRNQMLQAATLAMNKKLTQRNQSLEERMAGLADQNQQLARANEAWEQNMHRSVNLCLRALETFHPALGSQARRAQEICRAMAEANQLSPNEQQILELSAWLHDLGLVGMPRQLIKRWQLSPESLTEAEKALIQHHPLLGQELASFGPPLEAVGAVIRSHHERFDGAGYPDRLRGENIPWLSRWLTVATAYAESHGEPKAAIEAVKKGSGTAYDPEAVGCFLRGLSQEVVPPRPASESMGR